MRTLLAFLLLASTASAQNMWQMNAAMQSTYNQAFQAATPYYAPAYPVYRSAFTPRYVAPVGRAYRYDYGVSRWSAEQDQLREMRRANRTLQQMEWDLQDIANAAKFR